MYLKVILDRSEFISESVSVGENDVLKSSSLTFYLLLPVILHDNECKISVDWKIIRRCLSSPVFRTPEDNAMVEKYPLGGYLRLANGCRSRSDDVVNSLVYAPHKNEFYFITNIIHGMNGYSPCKDSETSSCAQRLCEKYKTRLVDYFYLLFHSRFLVNNTFYEFFILSTINFLLYNFYIKCWKSGLALSLSTLNNLF